MTDLYLLDTGKPDLESLPFDQIPDLRETSPDSIDWSHCPLALMFPPGHRGPRIPGVWKRNAGSFRTRSI